jgi:NAD(P)-dependent dehydrogenase (short-subunit alcohol dehydrogenase family)
MSDTRQKARTGSARPDLPLAVVISAGGIGMAAARRLGQRNRLLLVDKNPDVLATSAQSLAADGYDVSSTVCEITDPASVAELAKTVGARGSMRILAHVAGLSPSMSDWRTIMRVNLVGAALVAEALVAHASPGTAAVFMSSLAGHVPPESGPDVLAALDAPLTPDFLERLAAAEPAEITPTRAYLLSKRGLNRMCPAKAAEWAANGARINSISPGAVASPMGAFENARNPLKQDSLTKIPMQREATMPEIADAVEFLTSDRAS